MPESALSDDLSHGERKSAQSQRWEVGLREALAAAFVGALAVTSCCVRMGYFLDDYLQQVLVTSERLMWRPWDTFTFVPGFERVTASYVSSGFLPWWTDPSLRISFFRPLSMMTTWFDVSVLANDAVAAHLHSIGWYLACVAGCAVVFLKTLPRPLAAIALLVFAVSGTHFAPVAWIANRNALIATVPALGGLWAYLRWKEGWRPGRAVSVALFGIALLGGESALAVFLYVVAHQLSARTSLKEKWVEGLPYLWLFLAYLTFYRLALYGAAHSGEYLDPWSSPAAFAKEALPRLGVLAMAQFAAPVADMALWGGAFRWGLAMGGVLVLLGVMLWAGQLIRRAADDEARALRWWFLGSLLSVFPLLSSFSSNRLLLVPSMGASVLIAATLREAWSRKAWVLAGLLVVLHGPLQVVSWPVQAWWWSKAIEQSRAAASGLPASTHDVPVFALTAEPATALQMMMMRRAMGLPEPLGWWVLSAVPHAHRVTRTSVTSFELETMEGTLADTMAFTLLRVRPLAPGARVQLDGAVCEVMEVLKGRPTKLRVTFDQDPEETVRFVAWQSGGYREVKLPSPGDSMRIERAQTPYSLQGQ